MVGKWYSLNWGEGLGAVVVQAPSFSLLPLLGL